MTAPRSSPHGPRRRAPLERALLLGAALVSGLVASSGCSLKGGVRAAPLPAPATRALAEARELVRRRPDGWRAEADAALAVAATAAPDWVAPLRMRDDLEREALLGHAALAARTAALVPEATAAELYLAGRLEGQAGIARIEQAARLDPDLGWAQHGLAWNLFLAGQARAALRPGRRAVESARSSYELAVFVQAEARYLAELGRGDAALARLADALADPRLAEPEYTELAAALALAELDDEDPEIATRGFWRAVALFERGRLASDEYERLGEAVLARRMLAAQPDPLVVLLAALAHDDGPGSALLRAQILLARGARGLAAAQWQRSGVGLASDGFLRARDLENGAAERALERWRVGLPVNLRDADGLPREPALRALVLAARASDESEGAVRFGEALLAAGWFAEAESWAAHLVARDPDAALALSARAASGLALLSGIRALLDGVDAERSSWVAGRPGEAARTREIGDVDELLAAMQPLFERYRGVELEHALLDSPRFELGGLAVVVHPGPSFSALDEREGRGVAGAPVPGLASELARLGRFGLFGQAPGGGGPDGAVLRVVGGEWREGEHLGVPFAGWVAWCEGADVESRPGRNGSGVTGAALHEGYWVDLEGVRGSWERVRALEREYLGADPSALERALAHRGPVLGADAGDNERARWLAPLGEGTRVLLAALRERPAQEDGRSRVPFDELAELTALHEEGHLTDRTRFLPLARKWPAVLALLVRNGFAPRAVARELEYRAQLVALCTAAEPRLALADCLADESEGGPLPHAEAYRELIEDFLRIAVRELDSLPALARDHHALYQLHLLAGDDVRRLARMLADEKGLLEE